MRVDARAALHLRPGERDVDGVVLPVDPAHGDRRDQDAPSREPVGRVHHEVADRPRLIVEVELLDVTDVAVGGAHGEVVQGIDAA